MSAPSGGTHWAWARLNADTLFLGLLLASAGTFAILAPGDEVTMAREAAGDGKAHYPLFYVLAVSYLIAGVLLVGALVKGSVRVEVVARSLLVGGVLLNIWRHVIWVGPSEVATLGQFALLAIVGTTSALRLSILLNKGGLVITRPAVEDGDH